MMSLLRALPILRAAWETFRDNAAKIGAAGLVLIGLGVMLAAAGGLLSDLAACASASCVTGLLAQIRANPHTGDLLRGLVTFKAGLIALGLDHKISAATPPAGAAIK